MASANFFLKPELALRRAIELQGINQDTAALELLHDVLSSRRHRTWSPVYESIMITYLDLCLDGHRSREAKDGLHQYRNLSQSQAPGSLEKVIMYLVSKAEEACTEAKASSDAEQMADSVQEEDDDGFGASPQAIMMSTMSTDPAKTQRDSAFLMPALKFLWETYRTVLDILRSNSKLEHVYHTAAQAALRFCRIYRRRMEFRHLCDMLRTHLGNLRQFGSIGEDDGGRSSNKIRGWEGWTAESIELYLQTRFAQLETASVLHRYTEGFRTVEDIYNILQISQARRKVHPDAPPPKAKLMAAYYEKLTTLFWVSENYLFHGFAWHKYYTLCKEYSRGMSDDMKHMQASAVLLAALCIPPTPNNSAKGLGSKQHGIRSTIEDDIVMQKMARMATLLGFHTRNPTREALLTEIRSKNILEQVPQYLRELYVLLEETSDPLIMVEQAKPLLEKLKQEVGATTSTEKDNDDIDDTTLGRYVKPLTHVLLLKLLVNLSAAYHTVSIDHLKKLTADLDMTFEQVEKSIVQFTQTKTLSVRIDHRAGCLRFGDSDLESDVMRTQLTELAKQLHAVSLIIHPPDMTHRLKSRDTALKTIRANLDTDHQAILERKAFIEKRKEETERLAQDKIREEARFKAEEDAARKAEEERRIVREQKLRELEKHKKIQQELENKEKLRFLSAMGRNIETINEEELSKIDTDALQKEHQEKIDKEKEEAERKTRDVGKKLDYLVRAIRIEELPLIQKKYEENLQQDRERYLQEVQEKARKAKEQWEADVKDKAILQEHSVFEFFAEFEESIMVGRRAEHEILCREAELKAEADAEKEKLVRARKRKEDEIRLKKEEEANKKKEEERKIAEEEAARKEEARLAKEAKEEEARHTERIRMEEERRRAESSREPSGGGSSSSGTNKYVPPSRRGAGSDDRRGGSSGSRFPGAGGDDRRSGPTGSGNSRYPGGGRYVPPSSRGREGGYGGPSNERAGVGGRDGSVGGPSSDRGSRSGGGYVPPGARSRDDDRNRGSNNNWR